jgi:hypothetical protein
MRFLPSLEGLKVAAQKLTGKQSTSTPASVEVAPPTPAELTACGIVNGMTAEAIADRVAAYRATQCAANIDPP